MAWRWHSDGAGCDDFPQDIIFGLGKLWRAVIYEAHETRTDLLTLSFVLIFECLKAIVEQVRNRSQFSLVGTPTISVASSVTLPGFLLPFTRPSTRHSVRLPRSHHKQNDIQQESENSPEAHKAAATSAIHQKLGKLQDHFTSHTQDYQDTYSIQKYRRHQALNFNTHRSPGRQQPRHFVPIANHLNQPAQIPIHARTHGCGAALPPPKLTVSSTEGASPRRVLWRSDD